MKALSTVAIALASGICMLSFATAIGSAGDSPLSPRLKIVLPSPSPSATPTHANQPIRTTKALDALSLQRDRLSVLKRGKTRYFPAPRPAARAPIAHQDVVVPSNVAPEKIGGVNAQPLVSCARIGMLVARITGDVTPGGMLTISGACFGSSGLVQMQGNFPQGPVTLELQSWTDSTVTARIPYLYGVQDGAVDIRLIGPRVAVTKNISELGRPQSSPVQLHFIATRETIDVTRSVANTSCAQGDGVHDENYLSYHPDPDVCGGWEYCGPSGTGIANHFCAYGYHFRGSPGSGSDGWALHLRNGWRLESVGLVIDSNVGDLATYTVGYFNSLTVDPANDPANVNWSVSWRTAPTDYKVATNEFSPTGHGYSGSRTLFTYHDGSYLVNATATGPLGTWPQ